MTIQSDSTMWWPHGFSRRDADHFLAMVQERLDAHNMAFAGTAPTLVADDGRQIFLGNLAEQCARRSRSRWPAIIEEFVGCLAGISNLSDPLAISPDVVRKSLRLRLYPSSAFEANDTATPAASKDLLGLVVRRPAMPGCEWLLYLRRPGAGQGVLQDHLDGWGITTEVAFALAREQTLLEEPAELYQRRRVLLLSGSSMFAHAAVLNIGSRFQVDRGYFVAVPNRHEVVAASISPSSSGIERMVEAVKVTFEQFESSPYRIHLGGWFVPPGGLGNFGENAEPIGLFADGPQGPELSVALGPKTRNYFEALR